MLGGIGAAAAVGSVTVPRTLASAASRRTGPNWDALGARLTGDLVLPSDTGYPVAKQIFWGMYDTVDPAAIAYCETTADARACVGFARANGIRAVARSGGHSFAGYSTGPGLVVDVSRINQVSIGASTVSVGGGTALVDALVALGPSGLAIPGGSHPSVGAGGFIQGGGSGWLTRTAGMASDRVAGAEVVLADGSVVYCSAREHPDLYWALRGGGGGNFGIVTRYDMRPVTVPTMTNFTYTWTWDQAAALWNGWQGWTLGLPDEISSALNVLLEDAAPGAVPSVYAIGTSVGSPDDLATHLADLVDAVGVPPTATYVTPLSYQDAMMSWFQCSQLSVQQCHRIGTNPVAQIPREPYSLNRNRLIGTPIPAAGIDDLLTTFDAGRTAGHLRVASYTNLGGAANAVPRDATAFVHRDSLFLLDFATELFTSIPSPADALAARLWVDNGFAAMDRLSDGESYQNFIDPALGDWRQSYYAENYTRLVEVKRRYDPYDYFRFAQGVGA